MRTTGILFQRSALGPHTAAWHQCILKRGLHPTQRTQRKERNEMTSLLDRPITAASDEGVCRWHAAKLWQTTRVRIKFDSHHKLHNK